LRDFRQAAAAPPFGGAAPGAALRAAPGCTPEQAPAAAALSMCGGRIASAGRFAA